MMIASPITLAAQLPEPVLRRVATGLRVGVWGGLLLLHAALLPTVAAGAGSSGWGRTALLVASLAYFALKLLDVSWLRLPQTLRGWVVYTLVVVLLHGGVMQTGAAEHAATPWAVDATPLLMAGGLALWIAAQPRGVTLHATPMIARLAHHFAATPRSIQTHTLTPPRAPPLR